jgi:hypothetical protein
MTNASDQTVRRYSDLLTTGYIKTGADGRKIFYPWGVFGSGYAFPSNAAYERLNDLLKIYIVVALEFTLPAVITRQYIAATILAALAMVFYAIWTPIELRRLQPTEEKLTYGEGLANIARLMPGWLLWTCEIASLVFVACGFIMLVMEPNRWMVALGGILFFGVCAVLYAVMLMRRRRLANAQC